MLPLDTIAIKEWTDTLRTRAGQLLRDWRCVERVVFKLPICPISQSWVELSLDDDVAVEGCLECVWDMDGGISSRAPADWDWRNA